MTTRRFAFVQLDVFTSRPLEGNQLAVFTDARGLSDDEMQELAREMNLARPRLSCRAMRRPSAPRATRCASLPSTRNCPFAGHPTLGTSWYLQQQSGQSNVVLDLKVGKIPVHFEQRDGLLFGEMRQAEPQFGRTHAHNVIAGVLGIPLSELDEDLPIQTVSTGMPFTIVPFRSLARLQQFSIGWNQMAPYLATIGSPAFFYFVCRETVDADATLHARMIFYNGEDPATGSAAGCCTAWAVRYGVLAPESQGLIEQGLETRRPSFIHVRAAKSGETITNVRVGGNVVQVINGEVTM